MAEKKVKKLEKKVAKLEAIKTKLTDAFKHSNDAVTNATKVSDTSQRNTTTRTQRKRSTLVSLLCRPLLLPLFTPSLTPQLPPSIRTNTHPRPRKSLPSESPDAF